MDTNLLTYKMSQHNHGYMYQATFEAQFMKKLSNTVTELKKKTVAYKKVCIEIKENIGPE